MKIISLVLIPFCALAFTGCAHTRSQEVVPPDEAARLSRQLVRESVVFETGAKAGAVVPEISAPQLRAVMIPEKIENNRLIEAHREWILEGDVSLLGIPQEKEAKKK
ncbi:MAG: hypothetical protein KA715_09235 [Xanthomonadaceae bacterium]|nr:hypothetical protein [Xanthomonadaceae bacterium]